MTRYPTQNTGDTGTRRPFDPLAKKRELAKTVPLVDVLGQSPGALDAVFVDVTFTTVPNTPQTVTHNLGRNPTGFLNVGARKGALGGSALATVPAIYWGSTALNNAQTMRVQCTSGGQGTDITKKLIVKLLVF